MKHELGYVMQDKITGFTGAVTGYAKYLTGCDQYLLQPKIDKTTFIEGRWFDENRLIKIKSKKIVIDTDEGEGACGIAPVK